MITHIPLFLPQGEHFDCTHCLYRNVFYFSSHFSGLILSEYTPQLPSLIIIEFTLAFLPSPFLVAAMVLSPTPRKAFYEVRLAIRARTTLMLLPPPSQKVIRHIYLTPKLHQLSSHITHSCSPKFFNIHK